MIVEPIFAWLVESVERTNSDKQVLAAKITGQKIIIIKKRLRHSPFQWILPQCSGLLLHHGFDRYGAPDQQPVLQPWDSTVVQPNVHN